MTLAPILPFIASTSTISLADSTVIVVLSSSCAVSSLEATGVLGVVFLGAAFFLAGAGASASSPFASASGVLEAAFLGVFLGVLMGVLVASFIFSSLSPPSAALALAFGGPPFGFLLGVASRVSSSLPSISSPSWPFLSPVLLRFAGVFFSLGSTMLASGSATSLLRMRFQVVDAEPLV